MEPIDGGAVDKTGELATSDSECFTDWWEAKTNVEVLSYFVNEELEQSVRGIFNTLWFGLRPDLANFFVKFILSEQVRDVTSWKNIVDID